MASSGKKGKKSKGTVISLQSFLSNGDTPIGTTQVAKKIRNPDGDDSDEGTILPLVYQLPTAPRANRIFDDESIPHKPPYNCYITNLPFDVNEEDIYEFFESTPIISLRLPREDGESGRVRGFGYVELENRDDLIHVLSLPDPSIKGRRIRIELSNENEQGNRPKNNRRGFEGFGSSSEKRDSTNWRRDNLETNFDRNYSRDRKFGSEDSGALSSWRTGNRRATNEVSPQSDRSNGRYRDDNTKNKNFNRDDTGRISPFRTTEPSDSLQERPKLHLKPRTLPLPEINIKNEFENHIKDINDGTKSKGSGISAEKIFGSAKPVDTAAREMEIEERLAEARRQELLKQEPENTELNNDLNEIYIEKNEKDYNNSTISWRNRNESNKTKYDGKITFEKEILYQEDRRRDNRSRESNNRFSKNRDRSNYQQDKHIKSVEVKEKDDKPKRESKPERILPKYQQNQSGPILHSSNMYSGLDDDTSE